MVKHTGTSNWLEIPFPEGLKGQREEIVLPERAQQEWESWKMDPPTAAVVIGKHSYCHNYGKGEME